MSDHRNHRLADVVRETRRSAIARPRSESPKTCMLPPAHRAFSVDELQDRGYAQTQVVVPEVVRESIQEVELESTSAGLNNPHHAKKSSPSTPIVSISPGSCPEAPVHVRGSCR